MALSAGAVASGAEAIVDCNCLGRYRRGSGMGPWGAMIHCDGKFHDPAGLLISSPDEHEMASPVEILARMSAEGFVPFRFGASV